MKKRNTDPNPYKAFNEFMIRQSVKEARGWKIEDNDQNELRASNIKMRGRSLDLEFYDSETEEFQASDKSYTLNNGTRFFRSLPVSANISSNSSDTEKKKTVKEKKWSNDSPDREGYSEKREDARRKKANHDKDGLQSAEETDPVLIVNGSSPAKVKLNFDEFSARRSG